MSKTELENYKTELKNSSPTHKNIDCSECSRCSECSECSRCSGCYDCSGCSYCSDCSRCTECSYCSDCSRCSGCYKCYKCSDCTNLVNGFFCHNLKLEKRDYDKYYICNLEVTEEEYNKKLKEIKEK